jgi:large subunit ribosomal protein L20
MPRVKGGPRARQHRKRILKLSKGYRGIQSTRYRAAIEAVIKAGRHSYADRKSKKREFRGLWIQRINAAARLHGLPYNKFIFGLQKAGVGLDRKVLAELAMAEPETFSELVNIAKAQL